MGNEDVSSGASSITNIGVSLKIVLYRSDGSILVVRRSKTAPSRPLHWDLPGGGLDFGEDPQDGIIREVKEETGLKIANPKLLCTKSGLNDRQEFWVTIGYQCFVDDGNIKLSYEHDQFKWIVPNDFKDLEASPRNKKIVKDFIDQSS